MSIQEATGSHLESNRLRSAYQRRHCSRFSYGCFSYDCFSYDMDMALCHQPDSPAPTRPTKCPATPSFAPAPR
jgi:hypothetical protein